MTSMLKLKQTEKHDLQNMNYPLYIFVSLYTIWSKEV